MDALRIVGVKRDHGRILAAGHRHDIAGDIGVIGGFAVAGGQPPPGGIDQSGDHDREADPEKSGAAHLGPAGACFADLAHRLTSSTGAPDSWPGSKPPPTANSSVMRWLAARERSAAISRRSDSKVASAVSMGICPERPRR